MLFESLFLTNILKLFIFFITGVLPILIVVAFLTLVERKILASIQRRRGPEVVGFFGLLQPFADGLKLFLKETIMPSQANQVVFVIAPILSLSLSLMGWVVMPFSQGAVISDINLGILYFFAISSLSVYGIIIGGWSSNSKYAFLGSLRSAAQMVSYEVSIGVILLCIVLCTGSLNLTEVVLFQQEIWFIIPFFPLFIMFFVSSLAETNRSPFDLPEAEAELVSGYNVEYSAVGFAFFFIGEYANIILMSSLSVVFFFGGWLPFFNISYFYLIPSYFWFSFKIIIILYLFVCVRGALPRYRYDQLMQLGWKVFLPFSLAWFVFFAFNLVLFDLTPTVYM